MDGRARLKELASLLRERNETRHWIGIRELLDWFGAERRGSRIAGEIRQALRAAGLRSEPDFTTAYIDKGVMLVLREKTSRRTKPKPQTPGRLHDASFTRTIGTLKAAATVHKVSPEDSLDVAVTKMRLEGLSEVAVVHGEKSARGIVSWETIGQAFYASGTVEYVRECIRKVPVAPRDEPLLEAIALIVRHGAVLVEDADRTVIGLVTTRDIAREFTGLAKPFFLLGEIEQQVRRLFRSLPLTTLSDARDPRDPRPVNAVHDLSLGELVRLLENPTTWRALRLRADQRQVTERLRQVCDIRNDVMHFEPDPPTLEEIAKLEAAEQFLRKL